MAIYTRSPDKVALLKSASKATSATPKKVATKPLANKPGLTLGTDKRGHKHWVCEPKAWQAKEHPWQQAVDATRSLGNSALTPQEKKALSTHQSAVAFRKNAESLPPSRRAAALLFYPNAPKVKEPSPLVLKAQSKVKKQRSTRKQIERHLAQLRQQIPNGHDSHKYLERALAALKTSGSSFDPAQIHRHLKEANASAAGRVVRSKEDIDIFSIDVYEAAKFDAHNGLQALHIALTNAGYPQTARNLYADFKGKTWPAPTKSARTAARLLSEYAGNNRQVILEVGKHLFHDDKISEQFHEFASKRAKQEKS